MHMHMHMHLHTHTHMRVWQVDGWTLPYKVEVSGDCPQSPSVIDCPTLDPSQCPDKEDLRPAHGEEDLQLHALHNKTQVVGCYSPCGTLSFGQWGSPANQH